MAESEQGENRTTLLAGLALGLSMAGHQIAETARDALFLGEIGPEQLPYVYLVLAAIGIPIAFLRVSPRRPVIALTLWIAAPITASFAFTAQYDPFVYQILYVWTGLATTVIVTFFWLFLGHRFSIARAKLTFPTIALGGIVGALVGASGARAMTSLVSTRWLLIAAGGCLLLASIPAFLMQRRLVAEMSRKPSSKKKRQSALETAQRAFASPYARVVGLLLVTASVTFTTLDYTFKAYVAANVDKAQLGSLFATFYIVLNAGALVAQLLVARRILLWIGLGTVVLFIPVLIAIGAAGVLAGGGLVAALALKSVDGSLKHSLHRTSTELLFVPMSSAVRSVTKPTFDIVGKRGGQALASLGILGVLTITHDPIVFAGITAGLGVVWVGVGILLRRRYLGVFRQTLREARIKDAALPELGIEELKTMLESLNSDRDGKVVGAMDVLETHGHAATIPDLILYHPSSDVLVHALRVFRRERRERVRPFAERLADHADPLVRAEALLLRAAVDDQRATYDFAAQDEAALVRGIAKGLRLRHEPEQADWSALLEPQGSPQEVDAQCGIASAFAYIPVAARQRLNERHLESLAPRVQAILAEALAQAPTVRDLPLFIRLLAVRGAREHARRAMTMLGDPAFEAAVEALRSANTPLAVRVHLPRTISRFPPEDAAPVLLACIIDESDELVRHKALRGLGRIKTTHPDLPLDDDRITSACETAIHDTLRLVAIRVALKDSDDDRPIRRALMALLDEAEQRGIEHVFRLLHLRHPSAALETVFRGATSDEERRYVSAREILTDVIDLRLRGDVLAMASTDPDEKRLEQASTKHSDIQDEPTALAALVAGSGPVAQAARRYAVELEDQGRAA